MAFLPAEDGRRARSAMLVTEPRPSAISYHLAVRLPWMEDGAKLEPWVRVTADLVSGDVRLACGARKPQRRAPDGRRTNNDHESDGA